MDSRDGNIYEFADFRLIPGEGLLLRNGEQVSLAPKAFSTLVLLVQQHGHLVEKTELIDRIWENAFVEEAAVSRCVWGIRNALGEDPKNKKFIQTVPKRGYRFVGEVAEFHGETNNGIGTPARGNQETSRTAPERSYQPAIGPDTGSGTVVPFRISRERLAKLPAALSEPEIIGTSETQEPFTGSPASKKATPALVILFAVVLLFSVSIGAYFIYNRAPDAGGTGKSRLAVLPLKPVNAEDRDLSFEFAIADSLILMLSDTKGFNVRQLSAVRKFVDLDEDPIKAGQELEVDYVLASNYQVAEGRIRVTSQLLNVRAGETEHTFTSETEVGNMFAVRDAITNQLGNAVFEKFGKPPTKYTGRRGTESEEAFNLFYEALYFIDKDTKDDSARAAEILGQAITLDPDYAQAWALRAQAYCVFAHMGGGVPDQMFTIAEPMLEKALLIDNNNAVAFTVRGTLNRDYHWNFGEAYKDLDRAIRADPTYYYPHRILAGLYYRDRRFAEAVEEGKKAVEILPMSVVDKWFLGNYLVAAGRRQEGIVQLSRVAEMDPSFAPVCASLWEIYHFEGDHAKAYENFVKYKEVTGNGPDVLNKYKDAYKRSGWMEVLSTELAFSISKDPKDEYSARKYYIAFLAALTGKKDIAFEYLDETFRYRNLGISFLKVDPKLDSLRDDPRFEDLLRRAGLSGGM